MLVVVYQPDIDESCKDAMLELFDYLNYQGENFKEYVYLILRDYSERHKAAFLRSNVVDFMNDLARYRRVKMFGNSATETLLSF